MAEDEPSMQVLLLHTLQRAGFHVTLAHDGLEAKTLLVGERFDLICSDVMMSSMTGVELCCWTKEQETLKAVPVVLLSSRAQQVDRDVGLEAGADAYLTKPFDVEELIDTVQRLIDGG